MLSLIDAKDIVVVFVSSCNLNYIRHFQEVCFKGIFK